MKHLDIVHVTWLDSSSDNCWDELGLVEVLGTTHTVGIYIGESDNAMTLALCYDPDTNSSQSRITIPHKAIEDVRLLVRIELPDE